MSNKMPDSWDSDELAARFLLSELGLSEGPYSFTSEGWTVLSHASRKLPIDEIIAELHALCKSDISIDEIREIKYQLESKSQDEAYTESHWMDLYRENLHWKTENALLTVSSLLDYIGIFWDDKRWDEYLDLKDSGKILWVNPSDTFDARTELDQCEWIVRVYVDCPFRSNKFEYHLIRLFMYIYARSACYEFHISYPISDYTFDKDLTLRELANESFAIENRKVLTYPNYTAKKHNPLLYYLSTAAYPTLIFALTFWYFEFPDWNQPELYISFMVTILLGGIYLRRREKRLRKELKQDKKVKNITRKFYTKIRRLMSFSIEGKSTSIDDFLDRSVSGFKFNSYRLRMPDSIKLLLERKKLDGDITIEEPNN